MRLDRLRELVAHCRTKPGFTKFDFNMIADNLEDGCGTCGCLMGEMSHCWPQEFQAIVPALSGPAAIAGRLEPQPAAPIMGSWTPSPYRTATENSLALAARWFDIPISSAHWLFLPYEADTDMGENNLASNSSLEQVLANVERFIAHYDTSRSPGA